MPHDDIPADIPNDIHTHDIHAPDIHTPGFMSELCRLALAAGCNAMRYYKNDRQKNDLHIERKTDNSPVTIADKEGEAIITDGLARLCPHITVIGEESAAANLPAQLGDYFFLLDPLDGTKEFINKQSDFTINIGLIEKTQPIAGVVYAPARARLFFTLGTARAFELNIEPKMDAPIDIEKARPIYARPAPQDGLVAVASRAHSNPATDDFLHKMHVKKTIAIGSSLKICLLATGEADIYPRFGRTMEWDIAAAHAILHAAGGRLTTSDGAPFIYGKLAQAFANPPFIAYGA